MQQKKCVDRLIGLLALSSYDIITAHTFIHVCIYEQYSLSMCLFLNIISLLIFFCIQYVNTWLSSSSVNAEYSSQPDYFSILVLMLKMCKIFIRKSRTPFL